MASQTAVPAAPVVATMEPGSQTAQRANHIKNINNISSNVQSEDDVPTDSHALAHAEVDVKGLVHKTPEDFDEPIVGGISNDDLWMLIRRFNKQIYHVKATPIRPLDNLDLNVVDNEEFSPDKLRSNIERLYINVVVGLMSVVNHIARLRSWREPRRTAAFCVVYFLSWLLDVIVPSILLALVVLIVYPPSRKVLFPPAPIALVDTETGGVQKPKAGVLGSHDSLTGAPERYRGEAVEQEASNLVTGGVSVAVGSAARKHDPAVPDDAPLEETVPDPTDIASATADMQHAAQGGVPSPKHDKTKKPMTDAVWKKMKPIMHILGDITDTYERFGNALSPTPPFPRHEARVRLAAVLAPMIVASLFTSAYMLVKVSSLVVGFGFFGDPILRRAGHYLNRKFPHWEKLLELRNSILNGVPTNAQVTITLLRLGEANGAPIPPPPTSLDKAPSRPASIHEEIPLDASKEEIDRAVNPDPQIVKQNTETTPPQQQKKKKKKGFGSTIVSFFRGTSATGVETKLAVDRARAAAGSRNAKNHLGVLPKKGREVSPRGPVEFKARYTGKKGAVVIDTRPETAIVYFTVDPGTEPDDTTNQRKILFSMPIEDIQQVKKIGGFGWKGKLLVGWAEAGKEVIDGIQIVGKDPRQSHHITAMKDRDQLFNRLIAIGDQIWENC